MIDKEKILKEASLDYAVSKIGAVSVNTKERIQKYSEDFLKIAKSHDVKMYYEKPAIQVDLESLKVKILEAIFIKTGGRIENLELRDSIIKLINQHLDVKTESPEIFCLKLINSKSNRDAFDFLHKSRNIDGDVVETATAVETNKPVYVVEEIASSENVIQQYNKLLDVLRKTKAALNEI